ncbi:iron hydrogenase [Chlamydoabsidia padenii]|nr:iron hydrogenase [Chlamydoabsidia padenii]
MAFSSALILTDLNDYIAPSQECIKPVEVKKSTDNNGSSEIKVDNEGSYYEISQDGGESKLEQASISLNDCLACSGCVTSAESVLITMQSQEELYNVLKTNQQQPQDHRTIVISISPQSRASLAAKYRLSLLQVHKRLVTFFKHHLGVHHVFDISYARDLSLVETAKEFVERYQTYLHQGGDLIEQQAQQQQQVEEGGRQRRRRQAPPPSQQQQSIPMLASSCPGWVCYAEKTHGEVLPHISAAKSPQQMMGSLIKDYLATKTNTRPDRIYHVSVMPCYDKKLEASRPDFFLETFNTREVDCVLTTGEVDKMFMEQNIDFSQLPESPIDDIFNKISTSHQQETVYGTFGSSSGGALEYILASAAKELFQLNDVPVDPQEQQTGRVVIKTGKNADVKEYMLQSDDGRTLLRFASAYGFRNIQNIVRKIKTGKCNYHYVEVMACPGGCANGGGQLPAQEQANLEQVIPIKDWVQHVEHIYRSAPGIAPESNESLKAIYSEWIANASSPDHVAKLLRTQYHAVTQNLANPLATKW